MRSASLSFAGAALLIVPVAAQGVSPPNDVTNCWDLVDEFDPSKPANPYGSNSQIHMIPGVIPGTWHVALTCAGLASGNGGKGSNDILTGLWTGPRGPNKPTVAWNNHNAHSTNPVNTTNNEFGFMMLDNGNGRLTYAVWDDLTGGASLSLGWWDPAQSKWKEIPVTTPAGYLGDPALLNFDGATWVAYIVGANIVANKITLTPTGGTHVGGVVTLVNGIAQAHSPTPIVDSNGQTNGMSHHETGSGDSDHYFSFDLKNTTASRKVASWDTGAWYNNGAYAGGRFFDAHSGPPAASQSCKPSPPTGYRIYSRDAYWYAGGRGQNGTTIPLTAHISPGLGQPAFSVFTISLGGYLAPCAQFPFGCLGVQLPFIILGVAQHNPLTGSAAIALPIPSGLTFDLASMAIGVDQNIPVPSLRLSNSAALESR